MENNQAKGASKWLTSRRLIDFYPLFFSLSVFRVYQVSVCERGVYRYIFFFSFFKLKKKSGGGGGEEVVC